MNSCDFSVATNQPGDSTGSRYHAELMKPGQRRERLNANEINRQP
nr:MAG TPA: hypothetical protein [Caudoviricetes sp.]